MSVRYEVDYTPPGSRKSRKLRLGWRATECLQFLMHRKSATRVEMLNHSSPRLALNASSTISNRNRSAPSPDFASKSQRSSRQS